MAGGGICVNDKVREIFCATYTIFAVCAGTLLSRSFKHERVCSKAANGHEHSYQVMYEDNTSDNKRRKIGGFIPNI